MVRILWLAALWATVIPTAAVAQSSRETANARLLQRLQRVHALSDAQVESLRVIFDRSAYLGQGNPAVTVHPASEAECRAKLQTLGLDYQNEEFLRICGRPFMAPLYDPQSQNPAQATVCIDQFEFPDIPCEFPVVWVRASEAARICEVMGKRLCDAHEWEGSCEGRLLPPDYRFDLAEGISPSMAIGLMRKEHNRELRLRRTWSYGEAYRAGICGTGSRKTEGCPGGSWDLCGSNTYPCGFFPDCVSVLGVYDLHGNAAEHMNLPLAPDQMARGLAHPVYGYTEMKGSWFVFDAFYAHDDWCRWRAPFWHGSRVTDPTSHRNYHLGFRCCDEVQPPEAER